MKPLFALSLLTLALLAGGCQTGNATHTIPAPTPIR